MKSAAFFIILMTLSSAFTFGQSQAFDPLEFLPPAQRTADASWQAAYAQELTRLADGALVTRAALRSAAAFCRTARFPSDPLLAASLVRDAIAQCDEGLRQGEPAVAVRATVAADWEAELRNQDTMQVKNDGNTKAEKDLKHAQSIAGGAEQSLPQNRGHANGKISDAIKEAKEKKEKKAK